MDHSGFLEVAVAAPLFHTLTYSYQMESSSRLAPGMRVLVPLGRRRVTGYVLGFTARSDGGYHMRAIADILDQEPIFPESMVQLYRWAAHYYHYPIGEVIKATLPAGLTTRSVRTLHVTEQGEKDLTTTLSTGEITEFPRLTKLLCDKELTPAQTRKGLLSKERKLFLSWEKQGLIEIREKLQGDTAKTRFEICACLSDSPPQDCTADQLLTSERKTFDVLTRLAEETGQQWIARKEIARQYSGARKALKSLAAKGCIEVGERRVYRDPFGDRPFYYPKPEQLSDEQLQTLDQILPDVRGNRYRTFLLHGVTGSGKTEVYIRAAEAVLDQGKDVLVLVPEIALASQLEAHFFSRFGDIVAILHSGLSQGERFDQWQRLIRGEARIVIGARSAIFAPLDKIGLIVVDEEHDGTYKQEDGFRYHARDLAVLRGVQQKAVVILGSATPSITSYANCSQGKYQIIRLEKRLQDRPLPEVQVVDLKSIKTVSGRPPLFSPELVSAIRETLLHGDQSLVFLNRRGFANLVICQQCGEPVQCRHCNISMTLHKERGELACHYCGLTARSNTLCSNCQSPKLIGIGFGTERVEEELMKLFPGANVARLDRDTVSSRKDYLKVLKSVRDQTTDILVGTQMITKGHHFPHVTLVGIVWADAGLGFPDYKAGERTFQVLSQVTGRAGRGEKSGKVIIQTYQPDHYSIATTKEHDYHALYEREIALREQLRFPPFTRLLNIRIDGENEERVGKAARDIAGWLKKHFAGHAHSTVLGPAPSPLAKIRGRYRWQVLLKGREIEALRSAYWRMRESLPAGVTSGSVKMTVDVDPENML
ncbi:primosomal protein N' [Thermodesulfobacteriota bacterium]